MGPLVSYSIKINVHYVLNKAKYDAFFLSFTGITFDCSFILSDYFFQSIICLNLL